MENQTFREDVLLLEGLKVSQRSSVPAFVLLLLVYVFVMLTNISLVVLIFTSRTLRQPMYLLSCNLSVNDIIGATSVTPYVLRHVFTPHSERYIRYTDCVVQAFCIHLYANASHTVLMIMAFDRCVAICNPLRYATVMTNRKVVTLSVAAWAAAFVGVTVLLGLSMRLTRCRRVIPNPYCDNASLFNLSCESVLISNVYGLVFTAVILGSSIVSITLTYLRIAAVCVRSKNKAMNRRALQTCSTHLAVYVFLLASCFIVVILHRFPKLVDHRKVAALVIQVNLPAFNTVIYGLQLREIRKRIIAVFHSRKVAQIK
ncbi:olfactory receptor 52N4-like [Plectropomus leopardus]|uniref:olfactory receptor 52N4-like n=1 Tax=Plectropomus leopardus TaxID=160734 RepID=UPI001C4BD247|nr:olfactory receptor 52N4-like [Plectropomus leopardus]XP_042355582.1 olfactory receptor 52N4-like [Plectropomus leopardus]